MKGIVLVFMLVAAMGLVAAQEGALPNRDSGTVNEMNTSPDQNQVLVGQRPSAGWGGSAGLVPDYSDRVSGKAFPVAAGTPTAGSPKMAAIAGNPGGMNQNSGAPMSDQAAMQAAKKGAAPNNSPEANPPAERVKKLTPSPGAAAATRPSNAAKTQRKEEPKR